MEDGNIHGVLRLFIELGFYKRIPCVKKTRPVVTYIAVHAYIEQQFMFVLLAHNIVQQQVLSLGKILSSGISVKNVQEK